MKRYCVFTTCLILSFLLYAQQEKSKIKAYLDNDNKLDYIYQYSDTKHEIQTSKKINSLNSTYKCNYSIGC